MPLYSAQHIRITDFGGVRCYIEYS